MRNLGDGATVELDHLLSKPVANHVVPKWSKMSIEPVVKVGFAASVFLYHGVHHGKPREPMFRGEGAQAAIDRVDVDSRKPHTVGLDKDLKLLGYAQDGKLTVLRVSIPGRLNQQVFGDSVLTCHEAVGRLGKVLPPGSKQIKPGVNIVGMEQDPLQQIDRLQTESVAVYLFVHR